MVRILSLHNLSILSTACTNLLSMPPDAPGEVIPSWVVTQAEPCPSIRQLHHEVAAVVERMEHSILGGSKKVHLIPINVKEGCYSWGS